MISTCGYVRHRGLAHSAVRSRFRLHGVPWTGPRLSTQSTGSVESVQNGRQGNAFDTSLAKQDRKAARAAPTLARQTTPSVNMAAAPVVDDKMIVIKEPYTSLIMDGIKTMELQSRPIKGEYFLADSTTHTVKAKLVFGGSRELSQEDYENTRNLHCVENPTKRYKKTVGTFITSVQPLSGQAWCDWVCPVQARCCVIAHRSRSEACPRRPPQIVVRRSCRAV